VRCRRSLLLAGGRCHCATVAVRRDQRNRRAPMTRLYAWCENPVPAGARRDAVCCSVRCRQAWHWFPRGQPRGLYGSRPPTLRLAYAELIERLAAYDG